MNSAVTLKQTAQLLLKELPGRYEYAKKVVGILKSKGIDETNESIYYQVSGNKITSEHTVEALKELVEEYVGKKVNIKIEYLEPSEV